MKVIMPHGTTTIIADPHEIANVAGVAGVRAMYKMTDDLPPSGFVHDAFLRPGYAL